MDLHDAQSAVLQESYLKNKMKQSTALEMLKGKVNVFLTGEPGAGKTFTINKFKEYLDEKRIPYAVTASTGIAASHIDGSTIHSWSGIGIMKNLEQVDIDGIRYNKFHYARIREARVLILDEVSMLEASFITDLDKVLRAVHKTEKPFGGIQVVMVGDFFQLPPVSRDGKPSFAFESPAWIDAGLSDNVAYLTEQHRQADPIFTEILTAMRFGQITWNHHEVLKSRQNAAPSKTSLFTHNVDVDKVNLEQLKSLPGKEYSFMMESQGHPKAVETLKKGCLSPDILTLKENAVVMFTCNRPDKGHVNGSIGIVQSIQGESVKVKLVDGSIVYPEKNIWKAYDERKNVKASISQLLLRLAWAITVHKSQGMSLDTASIDLSKAFEYGHGYVAISRVRSLEGLHLVGINENAFKVNPKVLEQDLKFRAAGV